MRKLIRSPLVPFYFWSVCIIILSGFPGDSLREMFSWERLFSFDKLAHSIIYFIQTILLVNGWKQHSKLKLSRIFFFSFLITAVFGALMELMQEKVFIARSGDLVDVIANCIGSLFALGYLFLRYRPTLNSNHGSRIDSAHRHITHQSKINRK